MTAQMEPKNEKKRWIQNSVSVKMAVVGFLIIVLLIPLSFVKNLVIERKELHQEVIKTIHKGWGEASILYGPIVKIPYKSYQKSTEIDEKTGKSKIIKTENIDYAYFFPEKMDLDGTLQTEPKHKGIYTTSVYNVQSVLTGNFKCPDFNELDIAPQNILWNKAQILIQLSNIKGVKDALKINLNNTTYSFETEFSNNKNRNTYMEISDNEFTNLYTLVTKEINLKTLCDQAIVKKDEQLHFSMDYNSSGSERFEIIPIGSETTMHLKSNWKNTGFEGEYLPYNSDKITQNGFDARWKVLQMNRPFAQQFKYLPHLENYAFGVNFIIPVDNYLQNERASKYGYLMISLTFLLFFLIQTMSKINIHPFQYLMVGLALVIFYTLLISISEHSDFTTAYVVASTAVIVLISLYSKSILKNLKFPLFIALSLSALYGFIFVIIQLENYALLVGSIGLFSILAAVMYSSRKIDWG